MINSSERLIKLEEKISGQSDVCSSGGPVFDFPESMKKGRHKRVRPFSSMKVLFFE